MVILYNRQKISICRLGQAGRTAKLGEILVVDC